MSFLDFNLNDVPDLQALPDAEYEARITAVEVKTSAKTGGNYVSISLDIPSEPNSKGISETIMLPAQGDDEKKRNDRLRRLRNFCDCFGIDYSSGIDLESAVGNTGWVLLKTETSEDYGDQNKIRRYVVGH